MLRQHRGVTCEFRYNHPTTMDLSVQIVRFVEEHQPPIVEAELVDSDGRCHTFIEKCTIFTGDYPNVNSKYPQPGAIRCEVITRLSDDRGRETVRVTTATPDGIESTEGFSNFVVYPSQLSE